MVLRYAFCKACGQSCPDISKIVEQRPYSSSLKDEKMFFFGAEFGDGSNEEHFHLGITSIGLLKSCLKDEQKLYHLDSTYKILR